MNRQPKRAVAKRRVLFLCTGNSARSQMAEGFLRHMAGNRFDVDSAGLDPRPVNPLAVEVMREVGIDISRQRSKGLAEIAAVGSILFLIIVCANAEKSCPRTYAPASIRLEWPFDDPAKAIGNKAARMKRFREVRDEMRAKIMQWLNEEVPPEWL